MPVARAAARRGGGQRARFRGRSDAGKGERLEQSRDPETPRPHHGRQHHELATSSANSGVATGRRAASHRAAPVNFRSRRPPIRRRTGAVSTLLGIRGGGPYAAAVEIEAYAAPVEIEAGGAEGAPPLPVFSLPFYLFWGIFFFG